MTRWRTTSVSVRRAFLLTIGLATFVSTQRVRADEAAPLGRLDLSPYRVIVRATFAADPLVTPTLRKYVVTALTTRIGQTFGATWTLCPAERPFVTEDDSLSPPDESGLERLTYAEVADKIGTSACDKAYLLVIRPMGQRWLIAGREWDRHVQLLGPALTVTTIDRRAIADAAGRLLARLYSPLLIVNDADRDAKTVTLTVRAGSIPWGDPLTMTLKKGALFLPVFRFLDVKGNVRKIQSVPWTYLVLEEIKEGRATCKLASSYQAPLAANMRRRVEAVAILLRPHLPETRLTLIVGKSAPRPLAGMFVEVEPMDVDETRTEAALPRRQELLSDRRGTVTIAADPSRPLRLLQVHSGSALLARRPFVSGVDPEVTLELADDAVRLNTQRDVDLLRVQLIEMVARRSALIARTRVALKSSDQVNAKQSLQDLEKLPTADFYLAKLNEIRVLSLEETEHRKDRVSERRIEDLCGKTRGLIEQYLPDDRLQTIREEVAALLTQPTVAPEPKIPASLPPLMPKPTQKPKPNAEKEPAAVPQPESKPKENPAPAKAKPTTGL